MESDSDGSNTGSERNDSEEEESESDYSEEELSESDDDSFVSEGGTPYISFAPDRQYARLMKGLRTNNCPYLQVNDRHVLDLVFENVDEFCEAVSNYEGIKCVDFGDGQGDDAEGPKLEITEENASHWNKLFQTFSNISSVEEVVVGGYSLSGSLMARLVDAVPHANVIRVFLPWCTLDGENLRPLVEYLLDHPSRPVVPLCFAAIDNGNTQEGLFDGTKNHFLADGGIIAQLCRLESVKYLRLHDIEFTNAECQEFSKILSSGGCNIKKIWIDDCNFADDGGKLVASSFANNKSLKEVSLSGNNDNNTFYNELIASLPLNRFIEEVVIRTARLDVVGLLKNVARQNKAVKKMVLFCRKFLNENDTQELQRELQQNHTLESIQISGREHFQVITRLNKAGRRYLSEDSTSNSKCIAVLAKVKNDLDCLYYHLRENPILCISYCGSGGRQAGNKRKAAGTQSS